MPPVTKSIGLPLRFNTGIESEVEELDHLI